MTADIFMLAKCIALCVTLYYSPELLLILAPDIIPRSLMSKLRQKMLNMLQVAIWAVGGTGPHQAKIRNIWDIYFRNE